MTGRPETAEGISLKVVKVTTRLAVQRAHRASAYGPDLARSREWYWDHKKKEEVCYTDDG